ncbi:MAG: hypothetical protein ABSF29_14830, partial [Tepidisphaeraceae bacterium]
MRDTGELIALRELLDRLSRSKRFGKIIRLLKAEMDVYLGPRGKSKPWQRKLYAQKLDGRIGRRL